MRNGDASIHRRALLRGALAGGAGALAIDAQAQEIKPPECKLGAPPHAKGPRVWMDMDQVEIDAAYDQYFYAPLGNMITKRVAAQSEAVRARLGQPLRLAYGPSENEKLDVYRARKPRAPIFVFIHGGSWQGGTAADHGYPAEMFVNAGAHFVAIDFIQIKEAGGDLRVMAKQVRSAIAWVYKNAAQFDGDPERL